MSVFRRLTTGELVALAAAVRSARLVAPFTETAVQRYCEAAGDLAAELSELHSQGLSNAALARVLEAVAATRAEVAPQHRVELVWSGPEAPGIANRDTRTVVRELFSGAQEEVVVAGFAVHQGESIFRRLADRMAGSPGLRVYLYLDVRSDYRDTTTSSELIWRFSKRFHTQEWPGPTPPEVYFDPRSLDFSAEKRSALHAKCIVVDRRLAFVTSANLTEAAPNRNIEAGVLIDSPSFAADLARHFEALQRAGSLQALP